MNVVDFINSIDPEEFSTSETFPTMEQIREAEEKLGVKFADDYIECLLNYGKLCMRATTLTGLDGVAETVCSDNGEIIEYANVVKEALRYRELECHDHIPANMYVIHDLQIDLCLIWQDETGAVYVTLPWNGPQKEADSLVEYLEMTYKEDKELDELFD